MPADDPRSAAARRRSRSPRAASAAAGALPARRRPAAPSPAAPSPPRRARNPLWAWFTGGNALTRIGVVVLFFGVAFLLKYFAEHFTVPIELRLAAVAGFGVALIALGLRLRRSRPGYGLSLQGAGAGILYLTTYAAFRLYGVLPEAPAVALLVAVAALTDLARACAPIRSRSPRSRSPAASSRRCWSATTAIRCCCSATSPC